VLLIASDGFYEAANGEGTLFGQTRVEAVLRENAARPSSQMAQQLRAAVDAFTGHAPLQDDRTVLVIRRLP
jgi:serine phosphatase RsbU (regulator of sigma subunit)